MPGLDLPHLITFEEEWRYAPNSQHGHLADQIGDSRESGEMYLAHLASPVYSAQEAGFESIDIMAAQYYTANFAPNSTSQLVQANSRSRDLRRLLQTLLSATQDWSKQQRQVYEEDIVRSAKCICLDELRIFRERQADCSRRSTTYRTESAPDSSINSDGSLISQLNCCRAGTAGQQRQPLLKGKEFGQKNPTQQEKRLLRQCLPETWSLLSELAWGCAYDFPPTQGSQVVYSFLHYVTSGQNFNHKLDDLIVIDLAQSYNDCTISSFIPTALFPHKKSPLKRSDSSDRRSDIFGLGLA